MTMKTKSYIIMGDPIPLARPRMGNGKVFDSQKLAKFGFGIQVTNQHGSLPVFLGPVHMDITFYFDIHKVTSKKREKLSENYHRFVPDLSNLIKFVEDSAIGIIYRDDCLISSITAKKMYADIARTEFTITELE